MAKQAIGKTLFVVGALMMMLNVIFLKDSNQYETIRWISATFAIVGVILTPAYSAKQKIKH